MPDRGRLLPRQSIDAIANNMKVDDELDLHGFTIAESRESLNSNWASKRWLGARRVRIIHGTGVALWSFVRQWADEKGIPWTLETFNPGVTILHPTMCERPAPMPAHKPMARFRGILPAPKAPPCKLKPAKIDPAHAPYNPAPPANTQPKPSFDPMEEEFKRLGNADAREMQKRKGGR